MHAGNLVVAFILADASAQGGVERLSSSAVPLLEEAYSALVGIMSQRVRTGPGIPLENLWKIHSQAFSFFMYVRKRCSAAVS
jgi:hypothetical protein